MTIGPDSVEMAWQGIGLLLLAITAAVLVTTYRRSELLWFLAVLFLPLVGAAAYVAMRVGRARQTSRLT